MTDEEYRAKVAAAKAAGRVHHIKVHLTIDPPVDGLGGEGLWALVDDQTLALYESNAVGMRRTATIDNDSLFYAELRAGMDVEVEMRGDMTPEIQVPEGWLVQ